MTFVDIIQEIPTGGKQNKKARMADLLDKSQSR